ncbi:ribosomal subunit interface protein [Tumebacillus algifaecis]|uniref:Ribosome hibernation promoting factor n=1 Tax=Tumebacillus algifaecis TaxID=1214604 RepID=A0A223D5X7_9BACL|nr:ribosome-associated translation inhibitor RaiA [Tumebacillus algifaecis]ASS76887.1 ribosomal subunit interface protein [Tumebacillus algifaecis]
MKIQVRGNHLEVTEALRQYVDKKIGRLEKYFHAPTEFSVHVTLSVVRDYHTVEVTMPINGFVLRAEEKSGDMYASIDTVSDKLEKQIEKHKAKLNKRLRQEGVSSLFKEHGESAVHVLTEDETDLGDVVRVKKFAVKPMPVDEAVMQMDLLGHDFFVFSNAETDEVNVVYKRKDGQYGLIEPTFA